MRAIFCWFAWSLTVLATVELNSRAFRKVTSHRQSGYLDPQRCLDPGQRMQDLPVTIHRRADHGRATSAQVNAGSFRDRSLSWNPNVYFSNHLDVRASHRLERQQSPTITRSLSAPPSGSRKPEPPLARIKGQGKGPADIRLESTESGGRNIRIAKGQPWKVNLSSKFRTYMHVDLPPAASPKRDAKATLTAKGSKTAGVAVNTFYGGKGLISSISPRPPKAIVLTPGDGYEMYQQSTNSEKQIITGALVGGGRIQAEARRIPEGLARQHSI